MSKSDYNRAYYNAHSELLKAKAKARRDAKRVEKLIKDNAPPEALFEHQQNKIKEQAKEIEWLRKQVEANPNPATSLPTFVERKVEAESTPSRPPGVYEWDDAMEERKRDLCRQIAMARIRYWLPFMQATARSSHSRANKQNSAAVKASCLSWKFRYKNWKGKWGYDDEQQRSIGKSG
jgi:hypothetical protein